MTAATATAEKARAATYYHRNFRVWYAYALNPLGDQLGDAVCGATRAGAEGELRERMVDRAFYGDRMNPEAHLDARIWVRRAVLAGVTFEAGRPISEP